MITTWIHINVLKFQYQVNAGMIQYRDPFHSMELVVLNRKEVLFKKPGKYKDTRI